MMIVEYQVAAIIWPTDAGGAEVPHYYSDQWRLVARPLGEVVQFEPVITQGWQLQRALAQPGEALGSSPAPSGTLVLDRTAGLLANWDNYDWHGARVEIYISTAGQASVWADYTLAYVGRVQSAQPTAETMTLAVGSPHRHLDQPVMAEQYRGFGGAARLDGLPMSCEDSPLLNAVGGLTYEVFGRIRALPAAETALVTRGDAIGLHLGADGRLSAIAASALVPTDIYLGTGPYHLALTLDATFAKASIYLRVDERVELVWQQDLPGAIGQEDLPLVINEWAGSSADLEYWELRIWDGARTQAELIETGSSPFEDSDEFAAAGGRCLWRFNRLSGKADKDDLHQLALAGESVDWAPSLDGDDPREFPGEGALGSKPWVFGYTHNVPGVLVDTPRSKWQFSGVPASSIAALYVEGLPLRTDAVVLAATAGDIEYQGGGLFACAAGYTFALFVAGQTWPAKTGQSVLITGWPTINGTYVVAPEGISPNGRTMTLLAIPGGATLGACPSGASIATPSADVQYTWDSATATATLSGTPEGAVTADIIGVTVGGLAKVSTALETLSSVALDKSRLAWDPGISLYAGVGEQVTRRALMDTAARAGVAWWAETRRGRLVAGSWAAPAAETEPVAYLLTSRLAEAELDHSRGGALFGWIQTIEEHPDNVPVDAITCQYRKARLQQDADGVAGQVPPARRKWLAKGFAQELRLFPRTQSSAPLAPQETALWRQTDARQWCSRAGWLFAEPRKSYTLTVMGIKCGELELGDIVQVESPHYQKLIYAPLAVVTSIAEGTTSPIMTIEVVL